MHLFIAHGFLSLDIGNENHIDVLVINLCHNKKTIPLFWGSCTSAHDKYCFLIDTHLLKLNDFCLAIKWKVKMLKKSKKLANLNNIISITC
jgi:hypothetical protein